MWITKMLQVVKNGSPFVKHGKLLREGTYFTLTKFCFPLSARTPLSRSSPADISGKKFMYDHNYIIIIILHNCGDDAGHSDHLNQIPTTI